MKRLYFFICLALWVSHVEAQHQPEKAGSFVNGQFVLKIDLNWNVQEQQKLIKLYDLDSLLVQQLFSNKTLNETNSFGWKLLDKTANSVRIARQNIPSQENPFDRIALLNQALNESFATMPALPEAVYGFNHFSDPRAFQRKGGKLCFFLPDNKQAKSVFIAGSFNQWSTVKNPLIPTDSGWVCCLPLAPGKHLYKFVIDGRWQYDPSNRNREKDGHRGYNSIVFIENHVFRLKGFSNARKVYVTGSFNNWNEREIALAKDQNQWEIAMYLKEGTHTYKFIADGNWLTDPVNPIIRTDDYGNENSVVSIGDTLFFRLEDHADAREVIVSGSFNAWQTKELKMLRTEQGWELPYVLAAGNYTYKFIVDGKWITDPANPFKTGTGDMVNSLLMVKPNHNFVLKGFANAKEVKVTGSFLGWNHDGITMQRGKSGWMLPYYLGTGRHTYKFIVDGTWMLDPDNPYYENNEFNTGNSVIWIE